MSGDLIPVQKRLMPISAIFRRYSRGIAYLFHWLVLEKPRGLDFSMRVKSIESSGYHGYALTSQKAFKNMLQGLPISSGDSFIDIGCGKGAVLNYASRLGFGKVSGIEIDPGLVEIARRNIDRLHLGDRVEIIQSDATKYDGYGKYSFFFLFNPFDSEIYETVIARILQCVCRTSSERTVWLLCYGASSDISIRRSDLFDLYRDETCPHRGNSVRIWKSRKRLSGSNYDCAI